MRAYLVPSQLSLHLIKLRRVCRYYSRLSLCGRAARLAGRLSAFPECSDFPGLPGPATLLSARWTSGEGSMEIQRNLARYLLPCCFVLMVGCEAVQPGGTGTSSSPTRQILGPNQTARPTEPVGVIPSSVQSPIHQCAAVPDHDDEGPAFSGSAELNVDAVVDRVLARNPTLPQMVASWQSASAKIRQVKSLEDAFFATPIAPDSRVSR